MGIARMLLPILLVSLLAAPGTLEAQNPSAEVRARYNQGVELQRKGDFPAAEAEYRAALAEAPNYAEAHANLGAVLIRLDRYEEAIRCYETALSLAPNLTPILLNIGLAHYRRSELDKAVDAFKRFLEASPRHPQATQLMALALVDLGRDEEALAYLDQALALAPREPALLYATGLVSLRQDKPYVSSIIKNLAEVPGGLPASHLLAGQQLLKRFQFEKAVEELEAAAKLNPNLPRLQYSLGLCYYKLGRAKEAGAAFEAELLRSPKDFSTLYYAAYFQTENGDTAGARSRIDRALALEPDSMEASALLAKILFKQGQAAEAVAPLESAVKKDPGDPEKRYLLGRIFLQLGRKEDAAREFNESKRLRAEQVEKDRIKPANENHEKH